MNQTGADIPENSNFYFQEMDMTQGHWLSTRSI